MVTAMNNQIPQYLWLLFAFNLLLTGCFGGTTQLVRTESQQRAESALTRGIRAEQKGNYQEADSLLSEALAISSSIEDDPVRTLALINRARLHRLQHDLPAADRYSDQALVLARLVSELFAEAAHEKALVELAKGNPPQALEWAQRSLAAEQGNQRGARLNLASRIQLVLGNWDVAGSLARSALTENRSAGHAEEEANSLRIMGIVARNDKKYTEGELILQEALAIDKRIGKSSKIATDLEELAMTAQRAGHVAEAARYLERASDVNLAAGRLPLALHNRENLIEIYTQLGNLPEAATSKEVVRELAAKIESQRGQKKSSATINPSSRP